MHYRLDEYFTKGTLKGIDNNVHTYTGLFENFTISINKIH